MTDRVSAPIGSDVPINGGATRALCCRPVGPRARQHRRCLWRHRHQPALRAARGGGGGVRSAACELTREAVLGVVSLILWALIVVVTLKYVLILLRADNNGEGGTLTLMALASRAVGRVGKAASDSCASWHHQRRFVLRRCRDHSGVVGFVRRRRSRRRHAGIPRIRRAADGHRAGAAVCVSVARHRESGRVVRADHGDLVCRDCDSGFRGDSKRSRRALGAQSGAWHGVSSASRHHRLLYARRRFSRRDRRRGALRRPRPFRPRADPACLARPGAAFAGAQLPRAGRAGLCASGNGRQSVLSALSRMGAHSDGVSGYGGNRHREPGGDHRRLFADQPGDPAWPVAAF